MYFLDNSATQNITDKIPVLKIKKNDTKKKKLEKHLHTKTKTTTITIITNIKLDKEVVLFNFIELV